MRPLLALIGRLALLGLALAVALVSLPRPAHAAPQVSTGLELGAAFTDLRREWGPSPAFHLGARGDLILLRTRETSMGIGPYLHVSTASFETLEAGGGASWLLPVLASVPLVVSAGGYARSAPQVGVAPGVAANLFFGSRGYNFHSVYGMANGLFVEGRYGFGDDRPADLIAGVRLDTMLLALPWIYLYEGLTH